MNLIKQLGLIVATALLAGCGGGSSDSPAPTPAPAPAASAALTAGATRAVTNEAVALNWTSANATSCTASGDWSGSIGVSGSTTVTFASAGTKTLTLTCGSAVSSASISVLEVTTFSVPTAVASLSYPTSYTTSTTRAADISTDPCAAGLASISYPKSWQGIYAQPTVSGAPLATAALRGIVMKDVWQPNDPTFVNGCTGSARTEFTRTMTRLKALGADYVTLTPWTYFGANSDGSYFIYRAEDLNTSTMGDTDLQWAVGEAHRLGLKVTWLNQIQSFYDGRTYSQPAATRANVTRFLTALTPYMLARASYLQSIGADSMDVSCACWTILESSDVADLYESWLTSALPQIRARFSGRLRMNSLPAIMTNTTISNAIDDVVIGLYWNITAAEVPGLTTAIVRAKIQSSLNDIVRLNYRGLTKPVIFSIGAPSRADFYTTGYMEETFCVPSLQNVVYSGTCVQRSLTTDYSLQAQHYEAYLEVIKNQTDFRLGGVEAGPYWQTEAVVASDTFPNLAYSPRNKPAEGILKLWFAR